MNRVSVLVIGVLAAASASGCEQWKAPSRIRELEARVNELSAEVSAIAGKPVGTGKDKDKDKDKDDAKKDKDKHGDDDKGDDKADKHDKAEDKKDDHDKDEHADADDEHAADADDEPAPEAPKKKRPAKPVHVEWTYSGEHGPSHWGELSPELETCSTGERQSPIDLELKPSKASPIEVHYQATAAKVVDTGHTLQVDLEPGSSIDIDGERYELVQFHVHTPSEHTIAGDRFPLEVHLVHKNAEGKLAVIGVLYDLGAGDKTLASIWDHWPKKVGAATPMKKPFDPSALLPDVRTAVRYDGSLTTPPCTEGVVWNVMRRTKSVSKLALDILRLHYPDNARPTMPIGSRELE